MTSPTPHRKRKVSDRVDQIVEGPLDGITLTYDDENRTTTIGFSTHSCLDRQRWTDPMPTLEGFPTTLLTMNLDKNRYITTLNESILQFSSLQQLKITRCSKLTSLPIELGNKLTALQEVRCRAHDNHVSFPDYVIVSPCFPHSSI